MSEYFPNFIVPRSIPNDVRLGLLTQQYKLYGGVIRETDTGRIVRHLVPVNPDLADLALSPIPNISDIAGMVSTYQMNRKLSSISQTTQQILHVSTNTMRLSGLNLAVSAMSFFLLGRKFDRLDDFLKQLGAQVVEIREFLERKDRARLMTALKNLRQLPADNELVRNELLIGSKNEFSDQHFQYRELLSGAESLEAAMAYEEFLSLTGLAEVRCLAELGMADEARQQLSDVYGFWTAEARRVMLDMIFGDAPERFLFGDYVESLPFGVLAEWLDFAYDEEKGFEWIDELRSQSSRRQSWNLPNLIQRFRGGKSDNAEMVMAAVHKLVARNKVYLGYAAQVDLFYDYGLTPSLFEHEVQRLAVEHEVSDYLVLEPLG